MDGCGGAGWDLHAWSEGVGYAVYVGVGYGECVRTARVFHGCCYAGVVDVN